MNEDVRIGVPTGTSQEIREVIDHIAAHYDIPTSGVRYFVHVTDDCVVQGWEVQRGGEWTGEFWPYPWGKPPEHLCGGQ